MFLFLTVSSELIGKRRVHNLLSRLIYDLKENTWMESEADKLFMENINKNIIDIFEHPQTDKVIHKNFVNMLGRLFNGEDKFIGTATAGSSEAIMLGLLAHKWSRKNSGRGIGKQNIIFGNDAHIC